MKLSLVLVAVIALIHVSRASSNSPLSTSALLQTYFPCETLLLRRSAWQTTYFESSILPESEQSITQEEFTRFTQTFGAKCDQKLPGTNHTLRCSEEALILVPPEKPRHAIVFMHGLQRREDLGNFLPFFSTLLSSDPELVSTLQVEHPLAPLRRITAAEIINPPVRTGRAWFDILNNPTDPPLPSACNNTATEDRLGLYRTAELIDVIVRSQYCKLSLPVNQVVLMGHSLGAVAVLEAVMSTDLPLAGAIAMSGVLPRAGDYIAQDVKAYNSGEREYTLSMIHGTDDEVLPFSLGNASAQIARSVMNSTGGGFQFKAVKGVGHFETFFQSAALYDIVRDALRDAFYCFTE